MNFRKYCICICFGNGNARVFRKNVSSGYLRQNKHLKSFFFFFSNFPAKVGGSKLGYLVVRVMQGAPYDRYKWSDFNSHYKGLKIYG